MMEADSKAIWNLPFLCLSEHKKQLQKLSE